MHPCRLPCWYLYTRDTSSVRLLTDEGEPSPELRDKPARALAELAAVLHAKAGRLGERELQHLQVMVAMHRGAVQAPVRPQPHDIDGTAARATARRREIHR